MKTGRGVACASFAVDCRISAEYRVEIEYHDSEPAAPGVFQRQGQPRIALAIGTIAGRTGDADQASPQPPNYRLLFLPRSRQTGFLSYRCRGKAEPVR